MGGGRRPLECTDVSWSGVNFGGGEGEKDVGSAWGGGAGSLSLVREGNALLD